MYSTIWSADEKVLVTWLYKSRSLSNSVVEITDSLYGKNQNLLFSKMRNKNQYYNQLKKKLDFIWKESKLAFLQD